MKQISVQYCFLLWYAIWDNTYRCMLILQGGWTQCTLSSWSEPTYSTLSTVRYILCPYLHYMNVRGIRMKICPALHSPFLQTIRKTQCFSKKWGLLERGSTVMLPTHLPAHPLARFISVSCWTFPYCGRSPFQKTFSIMICKSILNGYFSQIAIYSPLLKYKIMRPLLVFKSFRNPFSKFSGCPWCNTFPFFSVYKPILLWNNVMATKRCYEMHSLLIKYIYTVSNILSKTSVVSDFR